MRYIDMHVDTITRLLALEDQGLSATLEHNDIHVDLAKLKAGNCLIQNFAIFTPIKKVDQPLIYALRAIDKFYRELKINPDLHLIKSYADIEKLKNNEIGALLTIEDASIIDGKLAILRILYQLGVRMLGLTWNYVTDIGYPNIDMEKEVDITKVNPKDGLTAFGKEVVELCEKLGIIVDVSHLSDKGFWDVYNLSTKPFVASHSNARAICNVARNLDDEMILALKQKGGIMGLNFCSDFISDTGSINDLLAHIDHIVKIAGIDVIALGSDFDGIANRKELADASKMGELLHALYEHGYQEEAIGKLFYQNALRVYSQII